MTSPAGRAGGAWPEVVWGAAVLRGLDARARAEVSAAGAVRTAKAGERVFAAGEAADAFFVVARGACELRAGGRVVRRVSAGEAFGEEATLRAAGVRTLDAVCVDDAKLAEVKVTVFRRAAARGSHGDALARVERTLRRAAVADFVRSTPALRGLPATDLDALLDAVEHVELARGDPLFRRGDAPRAAYLVFAGLVRIEAERGDGGAEVFAYAPPGALVGAEEALSGAERTRSAIAAGASWALAVPRGVLAELVARAPDLLRRAREAEEGAAAAQRELARVGGEAHALSDLYRLDVARSLLVIDREACVRCGHCAWACADAHDDGIARLVRRGEVMTVAQPWAGERAATAKLLVASSCQHCADPACLPSCPTGAITRAGAAREVAIRAELCIGCGHCAKSCSWGSIEMAPPPKRRLPLAPAEPPKAVAVKCDLCAGSGEGPACVRACPVEAIARVSPREDLAHVGAAMGEPRAPKRLAPRLRAWPWMAGALLAALALPRSALAAHPYASGALAGALLVALAAYALAKRALARRTRVRPHYVAHLALGALAAGAVLAHTGAHAPANAAGALALAFWAASALGAVAALANRVLPARLARIERTGALPEDLAARERELHDQSFRALSGTSDGTKAVFDRILRPYAEARLGALALLARGARLADEEARLHAAIERALPGRTRGVSASETLVRIAVDRRALRAERLVQATLRALVPAHVVLAAALLALFALHLAFALRSYP